MKHKYKLINGWTKERVLEQVKKYNTGDKCLGDNEVCAYQNDQGNRCVVGAFIPTDHPGLSFEGNIYDLLKKYPDLSQCMPFENAALRAFQRDGHDSDHDIYGQTYGSNIHEVVAAFLNEQVE